MASQGNLVRSTWALLAASSLAGLGACFDLFHSTGGVITACQAEPTLAGCERDASVPPMLDAGDAGDSGGPSSVCAPTSLLARQQADRACAWLGACETPVGRNAFGPCTLQARMAYDCASNPNHRVAGAAFTFWSCMLGAASCDEVDRCVFPDGPQECAVGSAFQSCGSADTGGNTDVLLVCDGKSGVVHGENCAMSGQTCTPGGSAGAACTGSAGFDCDNPGCYAKTLQWCVSGATPSVDLGIDCADNGAQLCGGFPSTDAAAWVACVPNVSGDAAAVCTPSPAATCDDAGVATSCASGVTETIDCATLLGAPGGPGACTSGAFSQSFDWTSPCGLTTPTCTSDACDDAGVTLLGCTRGATLPVDCAEAGLGPCAMVPIVGDDAGAVLGAACATP
jgi:hypothetical protein